MMSDCTSMMNAVDLRHRIHRNPEPANQETQTTLLLAEELSKCPAIKIHRPLTTGLIAEYTVNTGKHLVFRADIDALPLKEDTDAEFHSENGYMHACGHDVHTAVLYGLIQKIIHEQPDRNLLFFFQPAEEKDGGAEQVLKTGFFDSFSVEAVFALHVNPSYPLGTIAGIAGTLFANVLEFEASFHGFGAHVAFPHQGKSAISALRAFLDGVDRIPRDPTQPFVCGIGLVQAGTSHNIIPDKGFVRGTLRSFSSSMIESVYQQMENLGRSIHTHLGVEVRIVPYSNYPEVTNDSDLFERFKPILSIQPATPMMGGEDFGYFCRAYPSLMLFLGTQEENKPFYGLHHPRFLPPDQAIEEGIHAFWRIVNSY